jgi:hypothetical protein
MTIVYILKTLFPIQKQWNIVMMGASGKVEERLFVQTNYFEELSHYFPTTQFNCFLVGPETSPTNAGKTFKKNNSLSGTVYRGKVSAFLSENSFSKENTLLIGFNPGFGSGFDQLLFSWCQDLVYLLDQDFPVFFTQANDYSDLRGETLVLDKIFENSVKYRQMPRENPFSAMTRYCQEGKEEKCWSSSATHFYGLQGWKTPMTLDKVKVNLQT